MPRGRRCPGGGHPQRRPSMAAAQRRAMARRAGEAMHRAGVRAGNKHVTLLKDVANLPVYREVMAGMGKRLTRTRKKPTI